MEASDLYKVIRGQVEHGINSLNQRIIWFVIAQSFFFSGYAILITGNPNLPSLKGKQHLLLLLYPLTSLVTVVFSYVDILSQLVYLKLLDNFYRKKPMEQDKDFPPVAGDSMHVIQFVTPILLPLAFATLWAYLVITH